jgi:hypothetical protein
MQEMRETNSVMESMKSYLHDNSAASIIRIRCENNSASVERRSEEEIFAMVQSKNCTTFLSLLIYLTDSLDVLFLNVCSPSINAEILGISSLSSASNILLSSFQDEAPNISSALQKLHIDPKSQVSAKHVQGKSYTADKTPFSITRTQISQSYIQKCFDRLLKYARSLPARQSDFESARDELLHIAEFFKLQDLKVKVSSIVQEESQVSSTTQ